MPYLCNEGIAFCVNDKSTSVAEGDDLCLVYYGKYGTGLKYLENRLLETYKKVSQTEDIPSEFLSRAINRIYTTVDDETEAWISALKKYVNIDVLQYFQSSSDWFNLRIRVKDLIDKRENLFNQYCNYSSGTLSNDFQGKLKKLILDEFKQYMYDLANWGYFSRQTAEDLYKKFEQVINAHAEYYMAMAKAQIS